MASNEMILKDIKRTLVARFGILIKDVIMFGSRVKGNYSIDSDYDILVILKMIQ